MSSTDWLTAAMMLVLVLSMLVISSGAVWIVARPPAGLLDLPAGYAALAGAVVGGVMSGGFALLVDWFRYRRLKRERTLDVLIAERLASYGEFANCLSELRSRVGGFATRGVAQLRWQEMASDGQSEEERAEAQRTGEQIAALLSRADAMRPDWGPSVQIAFREAFFEFDSWCTKVNAYRDDQLYQMCPDYHRKVDGAWDAVYDRTVRAIGEDRIDPDFRLATAEELDGARERGRANAKSAFRRLEQHPRG